MITIAVFMYNEEKYILDTLESIKYQIKRYGEGKEVQLILLDDCSKDRTIEIADLWVKENAILFKYIDRLYSEKNVGTCKKYAEMIRNVRGDKYIVIAGDELFAAQNIFANMEICESDILLTPVLKFNDYKIVVGMKQYLNIIAQSLVTARSLFWEAKLGCPVLNGALYDLRLLSSDVVEYMCRYRLVEDRPRVYKITTENMKLTLKYANMPMLLYRQNDSSVSGLQSPHVKAHNDDLERIFKDIYENESSGLMRWAVKCQMRAASYRGQHGIKSKLARITPYYIVIGMRLVFHWHKVRRVYNELMKKYTVENEKHLQNIHAAAIDFGNHYAISFKNS